MQGFQLANKLKPCCFCAVKSLTSAMAALMENYSQNLFTMRQHAVQIFQAGLSAVEPGAAIARCCQRQGDLLTIKDKTYDLSSFDSVYVIGAGKAGASMAQAVEALLGEHLSAGLVLVKSLGVLFPAACGADEINYPSDTPLLAAGSFIMVIGPSCKKLSFTRLIIRCRTSMDNGLLRPCLSWPAGPMKGRW
jgi:hypothetical protein